MSLQIDYDGLELAMTHSDPLEATQFFLDTRTGAVVVVDEAIETGARALADPSQTTDPLVQLAWYLLWRDGEIGEELLPAEEAAMEERLAAYLNRYAGVPTLDSHEAYQDMVDFTATVRNPQLRQLLEVALNGKGAFRRFKDVLLEYPRERERWFSFSSQRLRAQIDEWLESIGLSQAGGKD